MPGRDPTILRATARTLQGVGAVFVATVLGAIAAAEWHTLVQSRRLDVLRRSPGLVAGGAGARATRAEMARSRLVGRVEIERIGLAAIVEEGVDALTLARAAGHLPRSPVPGEPGNVVVAGHRDTVFRPLRGVKPGDRVRFVTPDGVFQYQVAWAVVVEPRETRWLAPAAADAVTLVTCHPFSFIGPAPDRFVVRAVRTDPRASGVRGL